MIKLNLADLFWIILVIKWFGLVVKMTEPNYGLVSILPQIKPNKIILLIKTSPAQ